MKGQFQSLNLILLLDIFRRIPTPEVGNPSDKIQTSALRSMDAVVAAHP